MPGDAHPDASRFRRTRDAHAQESAEDYVEAVAGLIEQHGEARVRDLARLMGVSHVTVTRTVSRLAKQDPPLLATEPRAPIRLTPAGRRMAAAARRRHEVVLAFLLAAGVPRGQAEIDAEGIEHHCSAATLRAMERAAGRLG